MIHINTKTGLATIGVVIILISGIPLFLDCSIAAHPAVGCGLPGNAVYSEELSSTLTVILIIGVVMFFVGLIIPHKPVKDDYKSAFGP